MMESVANVVRSDKFSNVELQQLKVGLKKLKHTDTDAYENYEV